MTVGAAEYAVSALGTDVSWLGAGVFSMYQTFLGMRPRRSDRTELLADLLKTSGQYRLQMRRRAT